MRSALYFRSECRGMGVWEPYIRESAFRKRSWSCRPHTTGALHQPSLKVDHLRTALRESDLPILIVVHDWALLPDAFQQKVTISYLNNIITCFCNPIITETCKLQRFRLDLAASSALLVRPADERRGLMKRVIASIGEARAHSAPHNRKDT